MAPEERQQQLRRSRPPMASPERYDFRGKHTIVTGAASDGGIGLEICKCLLARDVASISLVDVCESGLIAAAHGLIATGTKAVVRTYIADVSNEAEVQLAVHAVHKEFGSLDVVFANAGIGPGGRFMDMPCAHFNHLMDVNYMGVVHTLKAALPICLKQQSGKLVVTNSLGGYHGIVGAPACCASKFATRGLVESLRLELIGSGVEIFLANPTFTDTPMFRESQSNQPEAIRQIFASTVPMVLSASEVAEAMVDGVEEGRYMLRTPDPMADFFLNSCLTPCTKRPYSLAYDMILAPFYVWQHRKTTLSVEAAALKFSALLSGQAMPVQRASGIASSMLGAIGGYFLDAVIAAGCAVGRGKPLLT